MVKPIGASPELLEKMQLASNYYKYAQTLMPKVKDPRDREVLEGLTSTLRGIIDLTFDLAEEMVYGGSLEEVLLEDLPKHMQENDSLIKEYSGRARQNNVKGWLARFLCPSPRISEGYFGVVKTYENSISKLRQANQILQQMMDDAKKRLETQNGKKSPVQTLMEADPGKEATHFESYLREHLINLTPEQRQEYVKNPDRLFFDQILMLRQKYDPAGAV